jgi:hypothetical protein
MFGRGLVNPVDDLTDEDSPLKKLLEGLGEHFKKEGYKPREAMRWMCKSKPYGLAVSRDGKSPDLFSSMTMKPLNAEQIVDSLIVGLRIDPRKLDREKLHQALFLDINSSEDMGETRTAKRDVSRAFAMLNGTEINTAIADWVKRTHGASVDRSVRGYYWSLYNRAPTAKEMEQMKAVVNDPAGLEDLISAMVNSSEFIINH